MSDIAHMRAALALARRGVGNTWPNPSVGCVIVRDGRVVGRGVTAPSGRPHAERQALAMAGQAAQGATAYLTLEPCSHHGKTPPCADALIEHKVARVVVAMLDPFDQVNGQGVARLRAAGVQVDVGLLGADAADINAGFLSRVQLGRPLVTLKLATTLDGRIGTGGGESQWITSPLSRRAAHALRGRHDAVMVGVGTVVADDPDLRCRIPGFRPTEVVRIVVDGHLRTPTTARLVTTAAQAPTWLLHREDADVARQKTLEQAGAMLFAIPGHASGFDPHAVLSALAQAGLTRVMVEGGAHLAASLLRAGVVDRLAWFHAPCVMGGDGLPAAQAFGVAHLTDMPRFKRVRSVMLGDDMLSEYERMV